MRRIFLLSLSPLIVSSFPKAHFSTRLRTTLLRAKEPNRRERMEMIFERDGDDCVWCRTSLTLESATTDHLVPRLKGGPSWLENELASCARCNKRRGHVKPLDWLEECEGSGLTSNREAVERGLWDLQSAIEERGGQRKARPLLQKQLKRLTKN